MPCIIQYWHEEKPPAYLDEYIDSFRDRNPDMRHLLFHEKSAEALIEEHFTGRYVDAFRACAVPAMQADYFRYCAAHALGGACLDIDCLCLAPLRSLVEARRGRLLRYPHGGIANGFMTFRSPGHDLPRLAVEVATLNIRLRIQGSVGLVTGPRVLRILVELWQRGSPDAYFKEFIAPEDSSEMAGRIRRYFDKLRPTIEGVSLADAFDDVEIAPWESLEPIVQHGGRPFPYKKSENHPPNLKHGIYRAPR